MNDSMKAKKTLATVLFAVAIALICFVLVNYAIDSAHERTSNFMRAECSDKEIEEIAPKIEKGELSAPNKDNAREINSWEKAPIRTPSDSDTSKRTLLRASKPYRDCDKSESDFADKF